MRNSIFSSDTVVQMDIKGLGDAQNTLDNIADALDPNGRDLRNTLGLAASLAHRYLMGLKQERPPLGERGVLPVISGSLANSLFWEVTRQGGELVGVVDAGADYAAA